MGKTTLSAGIIVLGCLGLLLKAGMTLPPPVSSDHLLDRLAAHLEPKGFLETGRANLTADGTYRAGRFATFACREALIVMPLLRNGEFKGLVDDPQFPLGYVVAGVRYDALPRVRLWQHTLLTRIGLGGDGLPPVAAVADPFCVPDLAHLLR